MTQFAMTFNRPAVVAFFGEDVNAVRIRVEGKSHISIKPVHAGTTGRDVFPLNTRTRGGAEVVVSGKLANKIVDEAAVDGGAHILLHRGSRNWISGEAVESKPSKVLPTARLWAVRNA